MRLYDVAGVIRSKNAGPFTLTLDIFFQTDNALNQVLSTPSFCKENIASLYHVSPEEVRIYPKPDIRVIKVTLPRPDSGIPDVYGAQQHFPLADIFIGETSPFCGESTRDGGC